MLILDVCHALAAQLDPDAEPIVLDIEPLTWHAGHLYVYPISVGEPRFETRGGPGDPVTARQDFVLSAVYVTDNDGEEARQERDPALAAFLDMKRGTYMGVIRRAAPTYGLWEYLFAAVDQTRPRMLDKRSAAVRISGWRIVN